MRQSSAGQGRAKQRRRAGACPMPSSPHRAPAGARVVFTGPDRTGDYRPRKPEDTHCVGATCPAAEGTSDAYYLWRPAPRTSPVLPRRPHYAREIGGGGGVRELRHLGRQNLRSGMQVKNGPFQQAAEDKITHRYQNPWQPAPSVLEQQGHNARARLAWNLTSYEHPPSTRAAMIQDRPLQKKVKLIQLSKLQEMKARSTCRILHYQTYNHLAGGDSN
ncbi:LOW QUALITY PROTEIN: protein SPMIP2 [Apteryx mantelli]|uniref:LOW QUALITY PROTEIN: protein SPMIP2 n=1 Tax=Apteryx mantelli TaxID=2696672 RepID=A0ABM4EK47_9AVES